MISNNLKILQVIDTLAVGGAENVFVNTCNVLHEKKKDVTALFILKKGVLANKMNRDIPFFELNRSNKWNFLKMKECLAIIKKFDIIHCHSRHNYRYIKLVSLLFNLKSKIIFHDHSSNKKIPVLFNSFLRPKFIISVSSEMGNFLKSKINIKNKNVFVLSNLIQKISEQGKINYDCTYDFILVSNFKKNKEVEFIVNLIQDLNSSLLLVGHKSDKLYYDKIENKIKNKGINVTIKSEITNAQEILNNAKIGLHASMKETGPLVLIEYLAVGLPFLAYETGEVSKIVKEYYPEFFINNLDSAEWKKRINYIKQKKYNSLDLQNIYKEHFSEEIFYNKLINIYSCIIS